ncbi:MAG: TadE/TadG family type IV pilus assembly protein [Ahrensia sp.]|nr:TadE/TadG family type IV pilus assembly protein [Ahrensia sp.]
MTQGKSDMPVKNQLSANGKLNLFNRFRDNSDGVAAVEFALVVPLLLALYLGTVEISNAITVSKQTARVAGTIADLVTQQSEVKKADLKDIMDIGSSIYFPYSAAKPVIKIYGIDVDDDHPKGGKVVWSRKLSNGADSAGIPAGTDILVPTKLKIDETFVVKVTVEIEYRPVVTWVIGQKTDGNGDSYTALDMDDTYWLRPRLSDDVKCTDC